MVRFLAAVVLLASACSSGGSDVAKECDESASCTRETVPRRGRGNYGLVVSNQSLELPRVFITVLIDDRMAADDLFEVGSQHNFVTFQLELGEGPHRLIATAEAASTGGMEQLTESIDVTGRQYGLVTFETEAGRNRLRFRKSDEPFQVG